jgi:hypothetical protein
MKKPKVPKAVRVARVLGQEHPADPDVLSAAIGRYVETPAETAPAHKRGNLRKARVAVGDHASRLDPMDVVHKLSFASLCRAGARRSWLS